MEETNKEEPDDVYFSPNIIQVIKSRRMRWVGHVVHTEDREVAHRVLVGRPKGKRPLGRPRHNGRIILKWKWDGGTWARLIWLRIGTGVGCL